MLKVLASLQNFLAEPVRRDDRGVTAVEYAMLLVLVVGVIAVGAGILGTAVSGSFSKFAGNF